MRIKTFSIYKIVACLTALFLFIVSINCYLPNTGAANANGIWYYRHSYSDTDLASFTSYRLLLEEQDNSVSTMSVIGKPNFEQDDDESVVRINVSGGTGFIIDGHTIVTAAHCVYSYDNMEFWDLSISILNENNVVIDTIYPKYAHIPQQYATNCTASYDYALIYVEEDLSEYGVFSLGVARDGLINNNTSVTVSGYPQYDMNNDGIVEWGQRYKSNGNITNITSSRIKYNADTSGGTSGGPVYIENTYYGVDYKTAIAIHTSAGNYGVRITSDILKFYNANPYKTA